MTRDAGGTFDPTSFDPATVTGGWSLDLLPAGQVVAGRGCFLERLDSFTRISATRLPALVLGDRVTVYTWTGFGIDEGGHMEVGDDCVLVGPQFLCGEEITIGPRTVLSYNVSVADSDFHPHDVTSRAEDARAIAPSGSGVRPRVETAPVRIGADVRIGIGAVVLKGVTIGDGATVAPGTIVTADVPAGAHVVGNPGRVVAP